MKDKLFLAWFAGLIEGEASISLIKSETKCFRFDIQLSQTTDGFKDMNFFNNIRDRFGGSIYPYQRDNGKQLTKWVVSGRVAERVLLEIMPYIRFRKLEFQLKLTEYQKLKKNTKQGRPIKNQNPYFSIENK